MSPTGWAHGVNGLCHYPGSHPFPCFTRNPLPPKERKTAWYRPLLLVVQKTLYLFHSSSLPCDSFRLNSIPVSYRTNIVFSRDLTRHGLRSDEMMHSVAERENRTSRDLNSREFGCQSWLRERILILVNKPCILITLGHFDQGVLQSEKMSF